MFRQHDQAIGKPVHQLLIVSAATLDFTTLAHCLSTKSQCLVPSVPGSELADGGGVSMQPSIGLCSPGVNTGMIRMTFYNLDRPAESIQAKCCGQLGAQESSLSSHEGRGKTETEARQQHPSPPQVVTIPTLLRSRNPTNPPRVHNPGQLDETNYCSIGSYVVANSGPRPAFAVCFLILVEIHNPHRELSR